MPSNNTSDLHGKYNNAATVTLVLINLGNSQLRAVLPSFTLVDSNINTYVFTSGDTGGGSEGCDGGGGSARVSSWSTRLSGVVLALTSDGKLPRIPPVRAPASKGLVLPPQSVTLAVMGGGDSVPVST